MKPHKTFQWPTQDRDARMAMVRRASEAELRRMARGCDWADQSDSLLGWVMAQKGIDLGSALTAFFNGDPGRFNYLPKRDVPVEHRGAARLLDTICLRVNSGFYLPSPGQPPADCARLRAWLAFQRSDRDEGRRGRWVLDEAVVRRATEGTRAPADEPERIAALRPALLGAAPLAGALGELLETGLGRRLMTLMPRRG